jgi:hypothetical protein
MLYLAIDQHRKQLTVNLRDEDGNVVLRRQVSTRWQAVREFLQDMQQRGRQAGGCMVIIEVCGFNDWLLQLLVEYGVHDIVLLQPEDRQRHKTDRRDANRLGELLWLNRQRLAAGQRVQGMRRVVIPSPDDRVDHHLTSLRWGIGRERTRVLNRIKGLLRRHNLEQHCPTKGIQTGQARRWLDKLTLGELDRPRTRPVVGALADNRWGTCGVGGQDTPAARAAPDDAAHCHDSWYGGVHESGVGVSGGGREPISPTTELGQLLGFDARFAR